MRVLKAEVRSGVVYVDGKPVNDAEILSAGTGTSTGYFVIDKDTYFYLTKTGPDLTETLDALSGLLEKLTSTPQVLYSQSTGITLNPAFTAAAAELKTKIDNLITAQK